MMWSGSQTELVFEEIPFISDDDFDFAFDMTVGAASGSGSLSRSEETATSETVIRPKSAAARLLHGRSPLGLATPTVAADLNAVAHPARILQLICDERHISQPLTQIVPRGASIPATDSWKTLKAEPPHATVDSTSSAVARSHSLLRKRNTEPPLARCLTEKFVMKLARRRVVELAVGNGLARRFNNRRSQFM